MTYRTSLPLHKTEDGNTKRKAKKVTKATKKLDKAVNSDKFLNSKNRKQEARAKKKVTKAFSKFDKAKKIQSSSKAAYKKMKKDNNGKLTVNPNRVKNAKRSKK